MEIEKHKSCSESDKALSLIQANNYFATKILSRTSSVSASSRFYAIPGEIPFKWELKPGLPKDPPIQLDHHLSLSDYVHPPPTCNTLTIPRFKSPGKVRVRFWKKFKIKNKGKLQIGIGLDRDHDRDHASSGLKGFKLSKPKNNNEYFTSSSSSSSSSTNSFSSFKSSKIQSLAKGFKKWVSP